jgi:hypothetical protein
MKQTAVEWFAKELNNWRIKEFGEDSIIGIPQEVFDKAKSMEKQEIIDARENGINTVITQRLKSSEQYYKETFKSDQ